MFCHLVFNNDQIGIRQMARLTASEYAEKWGRRLKGSTQDVRDGIQRVSEAPGIKAAAAQDRMLNAVTESITSGKWARNTAAVSLQDWKSAALDKGVNRIAAGVDAAMPSQTAMAEKLLADVDAVVSEVDRMPNATLDDRLARMVAYARGMHDRSD